MPTFPSTESSRRGSGAGIVDVRGVGPWRNGDRREYSKSTQSASQYSTARRGSLKPPEAYAGALGGAGGGGGSTARPTLTSRTNSAPLVPTTYRRTAAAVDDRGSATETYGDVFRLGPDHHDAKPRVVDGQDEDEVAGVVGAVKSFQPFQNPELSEPLPEINIAVIGHEGVGKSTFVQQALNLPDLPSSLAAECKIPIDGSTYLVRLLELPLEEIDIDDDETINWPDTIEDKVMPRVDGALALYDVRDKGSIDDLPEMLNAISRAALPSVLVSCKCDVPPSQREVDPEEVEFKAKRAIGNLTTLQISCLNSEDHKRGVFSLLNRIVNNSSRSQSRSSSANRRRAKSTAVRPVSPRLQHPLGHSRASSEFTGSRLKDRRHARHDSTHAGYGNNDHLRVPNQGAEDSMPGQNSFLFEESPSEASPESTRSSLDVRESAEPTEAGAEPPMNLSDQGSNFDELVDRLLLQPTSKADHKFAAIFLALYRKFAAPGELLNALVDRFDLLDRSRIAHVMKVYDQMRYVSILEQWVHSYPGDFAFSRTKGRLRTFTSRLAETRIFAVAAKEINSGLEAVQEDDDTNWAFNDRDREAHADTNRSSLTSVASTLVDDPPFSSKQDLSGSTLHNDEETTTDALQHIKRSDKILADVHAARRQNELLQPIPRNPITKVQWHALMECPDDVVAKELTRIDWIMFLSIRPRDLVRHVSTPKDQTDIYKNLTHVNRMTEHFNLLASWVANYVLLRDKPKHRAAILEKFMRIARRLRELNNYNALGAIIAGVKSSSLHRLATTRELIPPTVGRDWLKLEILMAPSKSHAAYRLAWENSSGERIPYLPLHRRDLVTAEEGNKSFIGDERDGRINWGKFEIMGDVIVSLQRAQDMPYRFAADPSATDLIKELVLDVKLVQDEEDLYKRSLQCEPVAGSSSTTTAKFMEFFKR